MKRWYWVDLHVHTALSPCAADDMTPAAIAAQAARAGLHAVGITDHNSAQNCRAVIAAAGRQGLRAWPGLEVETSEEVHVLCLFDDVGAALELDSRVAPGLPQLHAGSAGLGRQLLFGADGRAAGEEPRWLVGASALDLDQVLAEVRELGGIPIPAHVERSANGLLGVLGLYPPGLVVPALEWSSVMAGPERAAGVPPGLTAVVGSDAHRLDDIGTARVAIYGRDASVAELELACLGQGGRRVMAWTRQGGRK